MITEQERAELVAAIEAKELENPEIVADFVLSVAEERGYEAGLAELRRVCERSR